MKRKMRDIIARVSLAVPLTLALPAAMASFGCQDDFTPASLITKPRLLGIQVQVDGDATRATPFFGESVDVSILVAGPEDSYSPDSISSMVIECTYPDRFTGIPICQEFLDLAELSSEALEEMFGVASLGSIAVPSQLSCDGPSSNRAAGVNLSCFEGAPRFVVGTKDIIENRDILLRGVVCTEGTAAFDASAPSLFTCIDGSSEHTHAFHSRIAVADSKAAENHNPDLESLVLEINGRPFNYNRHATTEDEQAEDTAIRCSSESMESSGFSLDPYEHRITLRVPDEAREELPGGGREPFELSIFTSHGEVNRRFTLFSDDSAATERDSTGALLRSVTWTAADTVSSGESQWVDFWITVRDQRGGFASLRRSACVMLPEPF